MDTSLLLLRHQIQMEMLSSAPGDGTVLELPTFPLVKQSLTEQQKAKAKAKAIQMLNQTCYHQTAGASLWVQGALLCLAAASDTATTRR